MFRHDLLRYIKVGQYDSKNTVRMENSFQETVVNHIEVNFCGHFYEYD